MQYYTNSELKRVMGGGSRWAGLKHRHNFDSLHNYMLRLEWGYYGMIAKGWLIKKSWSVCIQLILKRR